MNEADLVVVKDDSINHDNINPGTLRTVVATFASRRVIMLVFSLFGGYVSATKREPVVRTFLYFAKVALVLSKRFKWKDAKEEWMLATYIVVILFVLVVVYIVLDNPFLVELP